MKKVSYRFKSQIFVRAPMDSVWKALIDAESWPRWAKGFRKIDIVGENKSLVPGRFIHCEVKGKLPYTLRFMLRVEEVRHPSQLIYEATGDLEGIGIWKLSKQVSGTLVDYTWTVKTNGFWINLLGKSGGIKKMMSRNHDQIMEESRRNLERRLSANS